MIIGLLQPHHTKRPLKRMHQPIALREEDLIKKQHKHCHAIYSNSELLAD